MIQSSLLFLLKRWFLFTPVYQPDCSSDPEVTSIVGCFCCAMLTFDGSWRGNVLYSGWPDFKHTDTHTHPQWVYVACQFMANVQSSNLALWGELTLLQVIWWTQMIPHSNWHVRPRWRWTQRWITTNADENRSDVTLAQMLTDEVRFQSCIYITFSLIWQLKKYMSLYIYIYIEK